MRIDAHDLSTFWSVDGDRLRISPEQGSRFAKEIAGDWNPLHDVGARRYCVPGDLLFAVVLHRYGLRERMRFRFEGMLGEGQSLCLPDGLDREDDAGQLVLTDTTDKPCLSVDADGPLCADAPAAETFTRCYVAFSGQNFPHFLQPLMADQGVMFNLERPLVIYDSMAFTLHAPVPASGLAMALSDRRLEVDGRRAVATLEFAISADGVSIGDGVKRLLIGGLQTYDGVRVQAFIDAYRERIRRYTPGGS